MAYKLLSAEDGRPIMKDGDPVYAMDFACEKIEQLDEGKKTFIAVASTEDEDRDKDIIHQDGWDLKNFKKNPMIPWSHNYWGIPLAKSLRTWVDKAAKKLMFKPQFDDDDLDSMKIFNKYKNGFLTSFSVGFRGIEVEPRDPEDRWWGGTEFFKQELLEISAVTIPANPNATVSLHGGDVAQNLLQMGYPQTFAKTESGLFYPIRELGEYTNPEVKVFDELEGIQAIHACLSGDEDGKNMGKQIVGYFFDAQKWESEDVSPWIAQNNEGTHKHFYYDWKTKEDGTWEVTTEEEDVKVPVYDGDPIEAIIVAVDDTKAGDNSRATVLGNTAIDGGGTKIDSTELLTQIVDEVQKSVINIMTKFSEALSETFEPIFDKIFEDLNNIKEQIEKQTVVNTEGGSQSNDDLFEIDDSLISPNDKFNSNDDTIEIDDDAFDDPNNVASVVTASFKDKLKSALEKSLKIEL